MWGIVDLAKTIAIVGSLRYWFLLNMRIFFPLSFHLYFELTDCPWFLIQGGRGALGTLQPGSPE